MKEKVKLAEQNADMTHLEDKARALDVSREQLEQRRHALVARLRAGDRDAASDLVDEYHQQIYLYMRRLGHDRQSSEDLTQEVFFNAWHHIGQLKDEKALNSWLYRIASNVSNLYWRRHKHKEMVGIENINTPEISTGRDDEFGHYEQLEQLNYAVARLPERLKQTVVLHYMQQLTIAEAAQVAGIRQGTFKSRLNRALKALRKSVT
ncbi:MAG: RNA polymerase sigma factor [Sedimentisphaerales bacterium]|nr:RNA polymerase sigma factor [Sedimentisphaerales bacterium]